MDREQIIEKTKKVKHPLGEMESQKLNKGNWIAIISVGILAVAFMIAEGALGHFTALFAIACICYAWASVFYFCQYFVAKRPWPVLIGAVLHGLAGITMFVLYILTCVGVM